MQQTMRLHIDFNKVDCPKRFAEEILSLLLNASRSYVCFDICVTEPPKSNDHGPLYLRKPLSLVTEEKQIISGAKSLIKYLSDCNNKNEIRDNFQKAQSLEWIEMTDMSSISTSEWLKIVDEHLLRNTFIVGEEMSAADIAVFVRCVTADKNDFLDVTVSNINRWMNTIAGLCQLGRDVDEALCKSRNLLQSYISKCEQAKEIQKMFVLDDWKRCYSNSPKDVALKYFRENFDGLCWSIWKMEYVKLEGECVVGFVTSNLLKGFLQRADPSLRKVAFCNCHVLGSDGNFEVEGVWLFNSTSMSLKPELPDLMKSHPSCEYFTWKVLNLDDETGRTTIEEYWWPCEEKNSINGRDIYDTAVFK